MKKKSKLRDAIENAILVTLGLVFSAMLAIGLFTFITVCFVSSAAFGAVTPDTKWGDVKPNLAITNVLGDAGMATKDYVDNVAANALFVLTNDFAANFTPLAAPLVTNLVEDVLAPRTLEYHYGDGAITNAFAAPTFATSKMSFVLDGAEGDGNGMATANMYSAGRLRNYSVLIEEIPPSRHHLTISFYALAGTHTIYAQPKLYTSKVEKIPGTAEFAPLSWDLYTNDVPCVVTIREPEAGTLIVRRDRLNQDEVYLKLENGEAVLYTDGEAE